MCVSKFGSMTRPTTRQLVTAYKMFGLHVTLVTTIPEMLKMIRDFAKHCKDKTMQLLILQKAEPPRH